MPNTRDSGATNMNLPVRQLQDMPSSGVSAMAWPVDRLTTLTSIATHSVTAMYALCFELFENQERFTARLLNAMGAASKAQSRAAQSKQVVAGSVADNRDRECDQQLDTVVEGLASASAFAPTPAESEFPIKRYDTLTVQEISRKLGRLRDRRSLHTVLAYEAKTKARKGVAAAGEARLMLLSDS